MRPVRVRHRVTGAVHEAVQVNTLDHDELCEIVAWCGGDAIDAIDGERGEVIATPTGEKAGHADWVIRVPFGATYRYRAVWPVTFDAEYERLR